MTTKTDCKSVFDLDKNYTPETRGFVNKAEIEMIRDALEIGTRSEIELQNIRDMVVILYGEWFDQARSRYDKDREQNSDEFERAERYMDKMSAITCVIDQEKMNREMEV